MDVLAADDELQLVQQVVALHDVLDGVPPLGADDGRLHPVAVEGAQQLLRPGEEHRLPALALLGHLQKQWAELGPAGGVAVPGEHGIGVLQQIADGAPHRLPVRGGPAHFGKAMLEPGHDRVGGVGQGIVKIKAHCAVRLHVVPSFLNFVPPILPHPSLQDNNS